MELDIKRREYDEAMSLNSKITSISKEKPEEISDSASNFKGLPKPEIEKVQGKVKQTSVGKDGAELKAN